MGPIEIIGLISSVLGMLNNLVGMPKDYLKLKQDQENGLYSLMKDLVLLQKGLKVGGWKSDDELLVTELVYDIENFALDLLTRGPGAFRLLFGVDPRVGRINIFSTEIEKLLKLLDESHKSKPEQGGGSDPGASSSTAREYTPEESLVGIADPKKVILDLLKKPASSEHAGGQEGEKPPKVISIVGCPGVGKTALARAVYRHCVAGAAFCDFDPVAWVEAAGCNDKTVLLGKILKEVQADIARRASSTALIGNSIQKGNSTAASADLRGVLADKRYLIFIDDVQQAAVLKCIIDKHFPKNNKNGMVIVTTRIRQIASVCSSGSFVYTMKCLGDTDSENLLSIHAFCGTPNGISDAKLHGSTGIIAKCGGLPLALISVADHLSINASDIDLDFYDTMDKELGSHYLAGRKAESQFMQLREVLEQCFDGLPDYDHKAYMLSLSIFPRNHPINCKSLIRRLIAEGLVASGRGCLDELVNRCIVEPVQISSYSKDVKSCQVDTGIILEFIIHKSRSTNFVTLIRKNKEVVRNLEGRIRRLSVQSSTRYNKFHEVAHKIEMTETIRSLTIISLKGITKLSKELLKCKFLQLLDLEGCKGLDKNFFKSISKLVYLKYLSLRRTDVKTIPRKIEKLRCLQTLDVRETQEMMLPIQVIELPKLAFLLGKFVLPRMCNETEKVLQKSELHTVAEIVVNKWEGSEKIILDKAKKLTKVKVSCNDTMINNDFLVSLRNCFSSLDSVSIECGQLSQHIMASLDTSVPLPNGNHCTISRVKLSGKLDSLPRKDTLQNMGNLNKLQLSCTGLTSEALSTLQHIRYLQYLKLVGNTTNCLGGTFSVDKDGFRCLRQLCFQAPKLPKLQFNTGSMQSLISLQLLSLDISQVQVDEIVESIKHIESLDEVVLYKSAATDNMEAWKRGTKSNPSWPRLRLITSTSP